MEDLSLYKSKLELSNYRNERLKRCEKWVYIVDNLIQNKKLKVVEIGSGSSALLYNLHLHSKLECGYGVEPSTTRHIFAEAWKSDLKDTNIININN